MQGAKALPHILDGTLVHLLDSTNFEESVIWCEWVYYVDWENKTVNVQGDGQEATMEFAELTEEDMETIFHEESEQDGFEESVSEGVLSEEGVSEEGKE